jgi:hypothetical protein
MIPFSILNFNYYLVCFPVRYNDVHSLRQRRLRRFARRIREGLHQLTRYAVDA